MIVCLCHRVSDRDIHAAVQGGTSCFDGLRAETGVSTGCGCCHDCAREVFDEAVARCGGREAIVKMPTPMALAA